MRHYGCIEAGGTKVMVGLLDESRAILARARIDTQSPDETISEAIGWLKARAVALDAVGVAAFGPLRLDRAAPDWGHMLPTPKPGWSGADIAGPFARAFGCPVGLDTDVNAAALAESLWGASAGANISVYLTVGTGIGGGAIVCGAPVHGALHPEMGHASPPRHPDDLDFPGICQFHRSCFEGLASGPAILARWGARLSDLPAGHPGHGIIAFYLGHLGVTLSALLSPQKIVFGGGVLETPGLLGRIRAEYTRLSGGYFMKDAAALIVAPGLGVDAGLLGALALAQAL